MLACFLSPLSPFHTSSAPYSLTHSPIHPFRHLLTLSDPLNHSPVHSLPHSHTHTHPTLSLTHSHTCTSLIDFLPHIRIPLSLSHSLTDSLSHTLTDSHVICKHDGVCLCTCILQSDCNCYSDETLCRGKHIT